MRLVGMRGAPPALADFFRELGSHEPLFGTPLDRMLRTKSVVHTSDDSESPNPSPPARLAGARTHLAVPMLKDGELIGAILIYRREVRPSCAGRLF